MDDKLPLQENAEKPTGSEKWLSKFYPQICNHMHIIVKNVAHPDFKFKLMGSSLEKVKQENDLGDIIDDQLDFESLIS